MASDGLRSVGGQWMAYADSFRIICFGLHIASGWLARSQWVACTQPVGGLRQFYWLYLLQLAGGLHRFYWHYLFFAIASGWLTQILLALFVLCYCQWVAYVDFIGVICYSQGVVCTNPLTLCILASGGLAQFHLVLFSFISFTCSASGWYTQSLLLFLFFPFSTARSGSAWLEASHILGLCVFFLGQTEIQRRVVFSCV